MAIAWRPSRAIRGSADGWPTSMRGWRRWLERAECLEHRELAHRMYELAATLNQRDMPAHERMRVLELVRGESRRALDYLAGRIQSQPLPLPAAARAAYHLSIDLLQELIQGYERAVTGTGERVGRRRLALAAERALCLYGERMLRTYQTYTPLDAGFWQRVNAIYRASETSGVAQRKVADAELRFAPRPRQSPQDMFKRLLLFALAGTQGFRRGEAARLSRALESWKDLARLAPARGEPETTLPRFAIDLESPHGPRLLEPGEREPSIRVLDVSDLVVEVEQLREARGPENKALPAEDEVGPTALARLVESWHPTSFKRDRRARRGSEVDAEATLRVIHARLVLENRPRDDTPAADDAARARRARRAPPAEEPPADWSLEEIDAAESVLGRHPDEVRPGVNWTEIPHGRERSAAQEEARAFEAAAEDPKCLPESPPRWRLEDVSASGFRLLWDGQGSCRVAVGEPIALRIGRAGERSRWCLGLVRRMRFVDEQCFEIGVQLVARNTIPARVRPEPPSRNAHRHREANPSTPALLLPSAPANGRRTTLLLPAHQHHSGDVLEVDLQQRTTRMALGRLVEDTGTVSRYEIEPAPARGRPAPSDTRFLASR